MHHHKTNKTLKTLILSANQIGMDIAETVFTSQQLPLKTLSTIQIFQILNYYLVWIFKEKRTNGKEKGPYCKEKLSSFEVNMQVRKNVALGASGSHFATMRESMPGIKTGAKGDENPTENLGPGHIVWAYIKPPSEVSSISELLSYVSQ